MKYLDTGSRDPEHALATWLQALNPPDVAELRIQSGFFGLGGIGLLLPIFECHLKAGKTTRILIGSNDGGTLRSDVLGLAGYMGIPREGASLGIINFGNAYFHPKTYHVRRMDGSQVAYVGSANLSAAGLALHVEAGISLDTRDGDDEQHLSEIAAAIDAWFDEGREGLHLIQDIESIESLVASKVLAPAPKPKSSSPEGKSSSSSAPAKPKLKPVFVLPPVKTEETVSADEPQDEEEVEEKITTAAPEVSTAATAASAASATVFVTGPSGSGTSAAASGATYSQPSSAPKVPASPIVPAATPVATPVVTAVPKNGFPQYILFDPSATDATSGGGALTGAALPSGAIGLIVQLNLDSARHFMGGKGTANISIPIATVGTIRFGIYGVHSRPRSEFPLEFRLVSSKPTILGSARTSIQGYGYTATESGHADIRLLVPAEIRTLGESAKKAGLKVPTNGDFALLEWPTIAHPVFRLTFLEAGSPIANTASAAFVAAVKAGQVVGQGACWLLPGISPTW